MRWERGIQSSRCQISDSHVAWVHPDEGGVWAGEVVTAIGDNTVWERINFDDEAAAKAAVVEWMEKTRTQFHNVINAGCQPVDEE